MKIYSDKKYLPARSHPRHTLYTIWGINPVPQSTPEFQPLDSAELNMDRLKVYVVNSLSVTGGRAVSAVSRNGTH